MSMFTVTIARKRRTALAAIAATVAALCGGCGAENGIGGAIEERKHRNDYPVTVSSDGNGATRNGYYAQGDTVKINAGTAPAGTKFKNWTTTSSGVTFTDTNNASTWFIMPGNAVTVTAVFGYTVTVSSGEGMSVTDVGTYVIGDTVNITAGTAPSGQGFKYWTT